MNENDFLAADAHTRGSAWAELDVAFFELMDGLFSRGYCALAGGMLAANDNDLDIAADAERQAAMRRHPSARRRF
jgi:hypothetical protein